MQTLLFHIDVQMRAHEHTKDLRSTVHELQPQLKLRITRNAEYDLPSIVLCRDSPHRDKALISSKCLKPFGKSSL